MKRYKFDTTALNAISFSAVAEKYAKGIVHKGAQLLMHCPWHDDHHPSLNVSPKRFNRCKCWACGKSAGVIDFVMEVTGKNFQDACTMLHEDFGIPYIEEEDPLQLPLLRGREASGKKVVKKKKSMNAADAIKNVRGIIDKESLSRTRMKEWDEKQKANTAYFRFDWYEQFISNESSFCKCLRSIATDEGIELVVNDYFLGCYDKLGNPDDVMFPSIDMQGRIHNIKVQHYCTDPQSPRFLHKDDKHTFWLGSLIAKQETNHSQIFLLPDENAAGLGTPPSGEMEWALGVSPLSFDSTCFFGEHLLANYPDSTVVLVESPKNAIIGTLAFANLIWIAVGNKNNLTPERLECLRNRKVIVIPDADALDEWKAKIDKCKDIATFTFSSFCQTQLNECGAKGDVADWLIEKWIK